MGFNRMPSSAESGRAGKGWLGAFVEVLGRPMLANRLITAPRRPRKSEDRTLFLSPVGETLGLVRPKSSVRFRERVSCWERMEGVNVPRPDRLRDPVQGVSPAQASVVDGGEPKSGRAVVLALETVKDRLGMKRIVEEELKKQTGWKSIEMAAQWQNERDIFPSG